MKVGRSAVVWVVGVLTAVGVGYLGWSVANDRAHPPHDMLTIPSDPAVPPWVIGVAAFGLVMAAVWFVAGRLRTPR
jgi:hypothetical protein